MKRIFYAVEKSLPPNRHHHQSSLSCSSIKHEQEKSNSDNHQFRAPSTFGHIIATAAAATLKKNRKSFMHRISSFIIADIGSLVVVPSTNRSLTSLRRVSTVRAISRHRKCTRCAWVNEATNGPSSIQHKKIASWKNSVQLKHRVFRWNNVVMLTNRTTTYFLFSRTNRINHH